MYSFRYFSTLPLLLLSHQIEIQVATKLQNHIQLKSILLSLLFCRVLQKLSTNFTVTCQFYSVNFTVTCQFTVSTLQLRVNLQCQLYSYVSIYNVNFTVTCQFTVSTLQLRVNLQCKLYSYESVYNVKFTVTCKLYINLSFRLVLVC